MCVRRFCAILEKESPPRQQWQGLKRIFAAGRRWKRAKVSNHKPRKGTETGISITKPSSATQFQITNPARGRKLDDIPVYRSEQPYVSNHKPRKGTETFCSLHTKHILAVVSNHKPRKGTETKFRHRFKIHDDLFQITNPARGRKHSRLLVEYMPPFSNVSNHKPRKGTKKGLHGIVQPLLLVMPGGFVV